MLIKPGEQVPIAHLLFFLEMGEHLAHDCAKQQATLAPDERARRFLRGQARQESFHAMLFHRVANWLSSGHMNTPKPQKALTSYRARIHEACSRKDFLETILAEQVILESLGEAILRRVEFGMSKRNAPFARFRHMLLHQEEAHHGFGERVLEQRVSLGITSYEALRHKAQPYLCLTHALIMELTSLFEAIDEDPLTFLQLHEQILPSWLTQETTTIYKNLALHGSTTKYENPLPPSSSYIL